MWKEKGQSTVELALSLPILMLLVIGLLDFGTILHNYLILDHASREAARGASIGKNDAEIQQIITQDSYGLNLAKLQYTIVPDQVNRQSGVYATITVSYPIEFLSPLTKPFLPTAYTISSKTVMRVE